MIGKVIKYARKSAGLSQEELSKLLKMNRTTLGNYETEARQPTFETLEKILNQCNYKIYFEKNGKRLEAKELERKDI